MSIDRSGAAWKGTEAGDIALYLDDYTSGNYPVTTMVPSRCECGAGRFTLLADSEEGAVQRTCLACGVEALIADSGDSWVDDSPVEMQCACRGNAFEVAVGFSLRDDGEVRWITVGARCVGCRTLAAVADWKVDYAPSTHLIAQA